MRIGIVGGIFGKPDAYRAQITTTPETALADELERRGHEVVRLGHRAQLDLDGVDVMHVHHLSYGAVVAASHPGRTPLAFTPHHLQYASPPRRSAARYVVRRADTVVALSQTEARWQRGAYRIDGERQTVIPNGISEILFAYSPPRAPADGRWRLLYVGQLARFKGVDHLLWALSELAESHAVRLDLVYQTGMEEDALRRLASQLRLEVGFLGARSPKELSELYAASHLVVLPSLHEALPSVISEAMMVGRPIVATDVGAIREQLGGFGELVSPGDPQALAGGIRRVLDGYDEQVGQAASMSQLARRRFSIPAMVDAHERLYESLRRDAGSPRRHMSRLRLGTTLGRVCVGAAARFQA